MAPTRINYRAEVGRPVYLGAPFTMQIRPFNYSVEGESEKEEVDDDAIGRLVYGCSYSDAFSTPRWIYRWWTDH